MGKLRIFLKTQNRNTSGNNVYKNEINADNFKEIDLVLRDLKNLGLPIDKAIKEYNSKKSDWDASLGF
jgi:hypothetical protein